MSTNHSEQLASLTAKVELLIKSDEKKDREMSDAKVQIVELFGITNHLESRITRHNEHLIEKIDGVEKTTQNSINKLDDKFDDLAAKFDNRFDGFEKDFTKKVSNLQSTRDKATGAWIIVKVIGFTSLVNAAAGYFIFKP